MSTSKILSVFILLLLAKMMMAQDACAPIGWANYDGQTYVGPPTGGGNATPVEVTTFAQLKSAVESSSAQVIYVKNSMGSGYALQSGDMLSFKSNKTVIGYPGVTVKASFQINGASNVIVRNLTISNDALSNSNQYWDAVCIQGSSKRVWFDHCTVMNGEDGNFDVVKGADNVSVTWCIFTYSAQSSHNLSNLIGSSDTETQSWGKLNVTYANCWWKNVSDRTPRTRYGKVHVLNCYYSMASPFTSSNGSGAGFMANTRLENCNFENISNPCKLMSGTTEGGSFPIGCKFTSCTGSTTGGSAGGYTVFVPPYDYPKNITPDQAKTNITNTSCGAGPTMDSPTQCGCGTVVAPTLILTSGTATQSVTSGTAISSIVYTWGGGATDVTVTGLPAGLTATKNTSAKTVTIAGTPTATGSYTVTTVQSSGTAVVLSGTITVATSIPTLSLTTGTATQTVTTGTAITSIVYTWGGGATDVTVTGLPAGLTATKNTSAKTVTIAGTPSTTGTFILTTVQSSGTAVVLNGAITVTSTTPSVALKTGWNLIGCPLSGSTDLAKALSSIWSQVEVIKSLDSFYLSTNQSALNSLTKVEWGKGYMIKVKSDCSLDWIVR